MNSLSYPADSTLPDYDLSRKLGNQSGKDLDLRTIADSLDCITSLAREMTSTAFACGAMVITLMMAFGLIQSFSR